MTMNHVTIICANCSAKLKMKPGLLKVMKTIKCAKCGKGIILADAVQTDGEEQAIQPAAATAAAAPKPPPPAEKPKTEPAAPAKPLVKIQPDIKPAAAPLPKAPEPTQNAEQIDKLKAAHAEQIAELKAAHARQTAELTANYEKTIESLKSELQNSRQEISELDDRVASLQELWHSKEVESRQIADRARKASEESEKVLKMRDDILGRIKRELAVFLVSEREASLARFSELETKLMSVEPEDRADQAGR